MLWTLLVVILIFWLLGWSVAGVGSIIHVLLVLALIIFIYQLVTGSRTGGNPPL